jgi:dihydropyrimidinase
VQPEDGGAITSLRRDALREGRTDVIEHSMTRPAIVEGQATAPSAMLSEVVEARFSIVHVSSAPARAAILSRVQVWF